MWWMLHADAFLLLGQDNAEKGIERDEKDKVVGLLITNGRVRNARFKRVE